MDNYNGTFDSMGTRRKLDLLQQHQVDWQLCLALKDKTWASLKQKHVREKQALADGPVDLVTRKQLIQLQLQAVKAWRKTMTRYRHLL